MRTIFFLLIKEFNQIRRSKQMLPIIFFMPVVQLLVLAYAATFEIKVIYTHIIDYDNSTLSQRIVQKLEATNYFKLVNSSYTYRDALDDMASNKASCIVIIPRNFEKDIINSQKPKLQFILNAIDGFAAGVTQAYLSRITNDFSRNIITEMRYTKPPGQFSTINTTSLFRYNPELDYKEYMVPGILVILVTVIGMFLSAMNIVREKELGTIEQLNVTPIKKYQFIIGKLLPFWFIALLDLAFGLAIAKLVFDIPIIGNIFLIFGLASLYLLVVQAFGLFISTITNTQQQAMLLAWFFMVVFMLMGGLFTPIESMPVWARQVTVFNPIAQFIEIMRRVILKGSGISEVIVQTVRLTVMASAMLALAIWRYRKVSG